MGMVVMIIIGLVMFIMGLIGLIRAYLRGQNWILTEGEVHSHRINEGLDNDGYRTITYHEIIRYEVEGREKLERISYSMGTPYAIGRVLPILYNPQDEQKIIIKTFSRMYLIYLVMLLCGFFLIYGNL